MSSLFRVDPRRRATLRWGGALAAVLILQSLLMAGTFWVLANDNYRRTIEHALADDCTFFALTPAAERPEELREKLTRDVHRDRFLGLFDAQGRLIAGNVARLPARRDGDTGASFVTDVAPTELPGKDRDEARATVCRLSDGTRLLAAMDLDDAQEALRLVGRSLMLSSGPALALALAFGMAAGRRAARQVDSVRVLTERIMSGDLTQRLAIPPKPDSFGLLCAHINAMLDRLQVLVGDVRGYGDDVAHQLRTPLTRLRARLERGMRDATVQPAFVAAGEQALAEIDALLNIVGALLRLRELEDHARRSRFAAVDLAKLAEDACDLHRPSAEDRGIVLTCDTQRVPVVTGDASLLFEAVSNLLDNAMKFGPAGGTVRLSVTPARGAVVLSVADDGPGVPADERTLVTQRFYRGRRDLPGAGLGLALVKAIAELHGFALRFASTGSAVSLVCPINASELDRARASITRHDSVYCPR